MRAPQFALLGVCLLALSGGTVVVAQSGAAVPVNATFAPRTSLRISTRVLRFDVDSPDMPSAAVVEFSAGARIAAGADIVLSVTPVRAIHGPGGAADVATSLTFQGEGPGTQGGSLTAAAPAIAARWVGSGLRRGRLVFSLRAGAPGTYTVPLEFVLSTP